MSPQRNYSGETMTTTTSGINYNNNHSNYFDRNNGPWTCSLPKGCLFFNGSNLENIRIYQENLNDVVKVKCTNENCSQAEFMHLPCFETFEEGALHYLRASGKAKNWTDQQILQNLWSKEGFEMALKACECFCRNGYLRKVLNWSPCLLMDSNFVQPQPFMVTNEDDEEEEMNPCVGGTRRKKRNSKTQNPQPSISSNLPLFGDYSNTQQQSPWSTGIFQLSDAQNVPQQSSYFKSRHRTNSFSSNTSGGSSFSSSASACSPPGCIGSGISTVASNAGVTSTASKDSIFSASPAGSNDSFQPPAPPRRTVLQDRSRHDSGGSIFQRRLDYSSFNILPKHKINSYHIKMEDECSIGNDETRIFILSSFASKKMNCVPCVVCNEIMQIYDRYPLCDGTLFLTPRQYNPYCIQVKYENKKSYLTPICMGCLESWTLTLSCRFCHKPWTGSHLVLGTMYSYDIFSAMPCCPERLKCNNCAKMVIHPEQRFNFFSDYSQMISCPHCGVQENHFCKDLSIYIKQEDVEKSTILKRFQQKIQQHHWQKQIQMGLRVHRVNSA